MTVRFAPSPTGIFHIGNLRTAWISYELAKQNQLKWVVRFEDIDQPRVVAGAKETQLADMEQLGLVPDQIIIQSENLDRHWQVFVEFFKRGLIYPCFCSRKQIREALDRASSAPHGAEAQYNGTCRHLTNYPDLHLPSVAWRLKMPNESGCDDFIIGRTDTADLDFDSNECSQFQPAYHWACAIDDYDGNYNWIVRAWDLESALSLQRAIQATLGSIEQKKYKFPGVYYCSLVVQNDGTRLEKRTQGVSLKEVQGAGLGVTQILDCFKKSLKMPLFATPEAVLGEDQKTLTLEQLNLAISSS